MNADLEQSLADKIAASRAGREVSPGVVRAAVRWALARYTSSEAEKAAKTKLHQLYGSYVGEGWARQAHKVISALEQGGIAPRDAAEKLLALHSSTRERLEHIEECYARLFPSCPPASVLDVACGLNPLSFFLIGRVPEYLVVQDAGCEVVEVLNRFFAAAPMAARAEAGDALAGLPTGPFDVALVMKFLPLAERMERGGAVKLLNSINAARIAVSFPTRSLSGHNVGMERNYSEWFESLDLGGRIADRFVCGDEVFYVVETLLIMSDL